LRSQGEYYQGPVRPVRSGVVFRFGVRWVARFGEYQCDPLWYFDEWDRSGIDKYQYLSKGTIKYRSLRQVVMWAGLN
jgi:hypothetical protein